MTDIKLCPRLAAIAEMVSPGSCLADVGTDHGLLPIWLLRKGIVRSAIASDIRPGPLSRAEQNARVYAAEMLRCVLCPGLEKIQPGEVDTVVIAGMGGENIAEILRDAPWTHRGVTLLLQPMSRPEELRRALLDMDIRIIRERLVCDSGRIYSVLAAEGGQIEEYSPAELYIGKYSQVSGEKLFLPSLMEWKEKTDQAIRGLERSARDSDRERYKALLQVRREMQDMEERYANGSTNC